MKKTTLQLFLLSSCGICTCMGETIDWDKIQFWSGEGTKKAALVVQFDRNIPYNPGAIVWGFRWNEGENPSGEDMAKAIAEKSSDLILFTQYTGEMGNTVCGFGYARHLERLLKNLIYDYEGALADTRISFGLETPNTGMNQTSAPGAEAIAMIYEAIDGAIESHVIEHPLNQKRFGYACYDYDWWQLASDKDLSNCFWNAGWYDGFWSFWVGSGDMETLSYSALGMTNTLLEDGDVNGWRYLPIDGSSGASVQADRQARSDDGGWLPLNYAHFNSQTGVDERLIDGKDSCKTFYTLDGKIIKENPSSGIYIVIDGGKVNKIIIK